MGEDWLSEAEAEYCKEGDEHGDNCVLVPLSVTRGKTKFWARRKRKWGMKGEKEKEEAMAVYVPLRLPEEDENEDEKIKDQRKDNGTGEDEDEKGNSEPEDGNEVHGWKEMEKEESDEEKGRQYRRRQ